MQQPVYGPTVDKTALAFDASRNLFTTQWHKLHLGSPVIPAVINVRLKGSDLLIFSLQEVQEQDGDKVACYATNVGFRLHIWN